VTDQVTTDQQLLEAGRRLLGPSFHGVYASDQVPKKFTYCITNVDTAEKPGSHWVAIAALPKNTEAKYMVYDSFGRSTSKLMPHLDLSYMDSHKDAEQSKKGDTCGARCLAWLCLCRLVGTDVAQLI